MVERLTPLRWRKRTRLFKRDMESHELTRGGEWLAIVQARREGGFYWYGQGLNTASMPPQTLEAAKASAREAVLEAERAARTPNPPSATPIKEPGHGE